MPSLQSFHCSALFSALSIFLLSSSVLAQATAPVADKTDQAASAPSAETFEIPDTIQEFKQLIAFVEKVDAVEPKDLTEQEMAAHQRKVARTVVAAADQLASKKISDEDAMQSVYLKLQGLRILQELDEPKADELLAKATEKALADKRPDVQAVGTKFMVEAGFAQWGTWGEDEKSKLIERIITVISASGPEGSQIDLVMTIVDFLGDMKGEAHAQNLLSKLMPHFQSSKNPQILQAVTALKGIERRMGLPGNKIKLTGSMLDGSRLDWESYRGKVVLVDFWATWCGPCRAEVPNVLKMYQAYHDKGFEVLGISLDERREQADSYIKQTNIPWASMFSDNPSERGWNNPMAVRYGITGIPRAILVDREGKVVHMTARGAKLGQELRRLLGEPVARSEQQGKALVQQVSNTESGN